MSGVDPTEIVLSRLENVKKNGRGHTARCPAHDDGHNSLKVDTGDKGQALVYCHAGCETGAVVAALDMTLADLYPPSGATVSHGGQSRRIVDTYDYPDDTGTLLYQVLRYEPKDFRQRRPDGRDGWIWSLGETPRVLYCLPELLVADPAEPVLLVEGEKDRDRLAALGFIATTNAGGADKWRPEYSEQLRSRHVVILPDNDDPGRKHAETVAQALNSVAASVRLLSLPGLPPKGDVSDWLDAGGTREELTTLMAEAPLFRSTALKEGVAAERKLRFHSAAEIAAATAAEPVFVARPWVAESAITEIDGKIKSSGKTTLCTYLCRAVLDGRDFMGEPTRRSPVVYLTEQSPATFREALRRADLLDREDLRVLFWHDTVGTAWPEIILAARAEAHRIGARVLVVDTLGQFSGVRGDAENNAGAALEAMAPLQAAAASDGLAVIILRHDRKGGGDVGDSGRGSSAFAGAVDVVLQLRRAEGQGRPGVRVLNALSRYDQTPDTLVIELTEAGYVALGDTEAVAAEEARAAVLKAAPDSEEEALREPDLLQAADVKRTIGQGAIREHLEAGRLRRVGEGKKGDPFRFWRPGEREKDAAALKEEVPAESISRAAEGTETVSAATQGVLAERNGDVATDDEMLSAGTQTIYAAERNTDQEPTSVAGDDGRPTCSDCGGPARADAMGWCDACRATAEAVAS